MANLRISSVAFVANSEIFFSSGCTFPFADQGYICADLFKLCNALTF